MASRLKIFQPLQSEFQRQPADQKREQQEGDDAFDRPVHAPVQAQRAEDQQRDGRENVERTQHEAQGAAEAADDLARVGLLQVGIQHAEADGDAVERERHHGDDRAEKRHAVPRHLQQVTRQRDERERDGERERAGQPVFGFDDARQSHRRHADDPQPLAFERKLREHKPRRHRGEIQRAGGEVQIRDEVHPERAGQLVREVPQVDDVNAEQAEEHDGLAPLRRVAPEHPQILHRQRAQVAVQPEKFRENHFEQAGGVSVFAAGAEPAQFESVAAAALHRRRGVVKQRAEAREGEAAEKQRVAQQHQREEGRAAQDALGPLQHGGRKPVAGQKRKHREMRLGQQLVERLERPLVEQFVVHRLRLPPERHQRQQRQRGRHQRDLKTAPVQKPPHDNRHRRAQHAPAAR